jgi:hypothetical protein
LHLVRGKIATNTNDVGQIFGLVNVAKGFSHLRWSFPTLDVRKLVFCQVEVDDGHSVFYVPLMFILTLGSTLEGLWKPEQSAF